MNIARNRLFLLTFLLLNVVACGGGEGAASAAGGAGGPAMPPTGVEIVTLEAKPVEQMTEFVGHRQIPAVDHDSAPGGRVYHADPREIGRSRRRRRDADGNRLARAAGVAPGAGIGAGATAKSTSRYAQQEADRAAKLLAAGAASQMDADRAANALKAAQAQLRTVEEQLRTSRADLTYYRVTAPTAGVVGDIPVREGDRVTKTTLLTTVDANVGFEVYLNVPVQQAPKLRPGLTVRLVDESGRADRRRENRVHLPVRR